MSKQGPKTRPGYANAGLPAASPFAKLPVGPGPKRPAKRPRTRSDTFDAAKRPGPDNLARGADRVATSAGAHQVCEYQVGDILGMFKLEERIADGGMASIFRAKHIRLEREVAIKIMHPEFSLRSDALQRFFREARAINQASHPNILEVTDLVEGQGHPPFIVMELLRGRDLGTYVREEAPIPARKALPIVRQICEALGAVHALGIVHRDLKPENVFLIDEERGKPRVKLLDFGIAKFLAADDQLLQTRTGALVGTPEYMAPEQVRGLKIDHRVDIYALGLILYELLTGTRPFQGSDVGELLRQQVEDKPAPPSRVLDDPNIVPIAPEVDEIVLACLRKDPADRIQTADELRGLVRSGFGDTAVVTIPLRALRRRRRRKYVPWIAAGIVAALLVGVGIAWKLSSDPGKNEPAPTDARAVTNTPVTMPTSASRSIVISTVPSGAQVYRTDTGRFIGHTPREVVVKEGDINRYIIRQRGFVDAPVAIGFRSPSPVEVALEPTASPVERAAPAKPMTVFRRPRPRARSRSPSRRRPGVHSGTLDPFGGP